MNPFSCISSSEGLVEVRDHEGVAPRIDPHRFESGRGDPLDDDVGILVEAIDQLRRHLVAPDELDVARLHRRRERLRLVDRRDDHLVELRPLGVVVLVEALEHHVLTQRVGGDPEGPGTHRLQAVLRLAHRRESAAAHDRHRATRAPLQGLAEEGRLRLAEHELDRRGR